MSASRHRAPHGPLFWRIYLHGVVLLVVVGVAVAVVGLGAPARRRLGAGEGRPAYAAARISRADR